MTLKCGVCIVFLFCSLSIQAGSEAVDVDKPSFSASQTVQLTATVDSIDREARTVTLKGPEGNTHTIQVSEDSERINQVEVGDTVEVEFIQTMTIEVFANDGMEPGTGVLAAQGSNEEGETPIVTDVVTSIETATVEEINIETNTFKLRWPGDEVKEYVARHPENLKAADVGDLVVVTYTEAMALSLQEVSAD